MNERVYSGVKALAVFDNYFVGAKGYRLYNYYFDDKTKPEYVGRVVDCKYSFFSKFKLTRRFMRAEVNGLYYLPDGFEAFIPYVLFVNCFKAFSCTEYKRYTPDARKSYDCINYTTDKCILSAAYPRNYIKLEKSYASPVKSADYCKDQRNSIHYHCQNSSLCGFSAHS